MTHSAALQPVLPHDPEYAWQYSCGLAEEIDKALCLVLLDAKPHELVHCRFGLWATLDAFFSSLPSDEWHAASMAWMPFPGKDVDTLVMTRELWEACCETEQAFEAYMTIAGIFDADD